MRDWLEDIAENWNFNKIVPSHFDAPVQCGPKELIAAFQRSTAVYGNDASFAASTASTASKVPYDH
jgi:hypothetical protein